MNKHLEAAQRATEQLIRDAEVELEDAKYGGESAVGKQRHLGGLRQAETIYNDAIRKMQREDAAAPQLLEALQLLQNAFIHTDGNVKGNKAKTDIITLNPEVGEALNAARIAIDKATQ